MAKDPAALFYIEKWFTATAEMKADCRGWFLNLILHQFDKTDLPDDIEELASLAQVRVSEYKVFEQVFEQVLKQKFERNEKGRLENAFAKEIIQGRELFKDKRSNAGKMSYFIKYVRRNLCREEHLISFLKKSADLTNVDVKDEQMLEQVFKQSVELYININKLDTVVVNRLLLKGGILDTNYHKEENPIGFNQFPLPEHFNGLSDLQIGQAKQYLSITKQVDLSDKDVLGIWHLFKNKRLTGKKYYKDESEVYTHFFESLKFEKFEHGKYQHTASSNNGKSASSKSDTKTNSIIGFGLAGKGGN